MLAEKDIRPEDLSRKQHELYLQDISRFTSDKRFFTPCNCPVCGSGAHDPRYKKYSLCFSECRNCGTIFTNPRPSAEALKAYYSSSENYRFWAKHIFPSTEEVRKERIFKPRLELLLSLLDGSRARCDVFLEIGPGFGTFCRLVRESGIFKDVIAIEPTPELADELERKGIRTVRKFFSETHFHDTADVITAFEVIEHIPDPLPFLEKCFAALKRGGMLMLTCPNGKGFDTLVLGEEAPALDFEHVTLFNPAALAAILEKCGFRIRLISTPGELDTDIVRNRLERSESLRNRHPLYERMFCREWEQYGESFQDYLKKNFMSGNLMAVAFKP